MRMIGNIGTDIAAAGFTFAFLGIGLWLPENTDPGPPREPGPPHESTPAPAPTSKVSPIVIEIPAQAPEYTAETETAANASPEPEAQADAPFPDAPATAPPDSPRGNAGSESNRSLLAGAIRADGIKAPPYWIENGRERLTEFLADGDAVLILEVRDSENRIYFFGGSFDSTECRGIAREGDLQDFETSRGIPLDADDARRLMDVAAQRYRRGSDIRGYALLHRRLDRIVLQAQLAAIETAGLRPETALTEGRFVGRDTFEVTGVHALTPAAE